MVQTQEKHSSVQQDPESEQLLRESKVLISRPLVKLGQADCNWNWNADCNWVAQVKRFAIVLEHSYVDLDSAKSCWLSSKPCSPARKDIVLIGRAGPSARQYDRSVPEYTARREDHLLATDPGTSEVTTPGYN